MPQRYEYYIDTETGEEDTYGDGRGAQTFQHPISHRITRVRLKLFRTGNPGTVIVEVRTTSAGVPTSTVLCSGSIDGNSVTPTSPGAWYFIDFPVPAVLESNVRYAIVDYAPESGNSGDNIIHWRGTSAGAYTKGQYYYVSSPGGGSWQTAANVDLMFEEWGDIIGPLPTFFK